LGDWRPCPKKNSRERLSGQYAIPSTVWQLWGQFGGQLGVGEERRKRPNDEKA
jgi:hypothetical protein